METDTKAGMICRVCASPSDFYVRKDGYDIYRCSRCGFGQTDVTLEEIADFYDKAYFDGEKTPDAFSQEENSPLQPSHRYWIEQQFTHLQRSSPISVLEIGPGLGGPMAGYFERDRPDIAYAAIEISDYASERLRNRSLTVHCGRVMDPAILEACRGRYDLVFGTEVIEHELDPHGFARAIHAMLKPGGRVAFTTGNLDGLIARRKRADWYYLDPPAHVSYYTPRAARHVFGAEGFRDIKSIRYGFRHLTMKLKTHIPGLLLLTHLANISTGMTISAQRD